MSNLLKIYIIIIALYILNIESSKADFFEIDAYGKVVSISKMARVGKISIFIISAKWCGPCKTLKRKLLNSNLDMETIDIWYINMSGKHNYSDVKKTEAYNSWRLHESLEEWPTVYITSPNTNVVKKFSGSSLIKEDKIREFHSKAPRNITIYENILRIIKILKKNSSNFDKNMVITEKDRPKPIPLKKAFRKYKLNYGE